MSKVMVKDSSLSYSLSSAREIFRALDNHWISNEEGIWRPSYAKQETSAFDLIVNYAKDWEPVEVYQDKAGNYHIIFPGKDRQKPAFVIGSHMDAVPNGGRYDGTAGVVAGLSAMGQLYVNSILPPQDVCLTLFRGEESAWFGKDCLGSRFMTGGLTKEFLKTAQRKDTRKSLLEYMKETGVDIEKLTIDIDKRKPLFPIGRIALYLETHIEQNDSLLNQNIGIGIVNAIRGNVRFTKGMYFEGDGGHSGAMPQELRNDTHFAASEFLVAWRKAMKILREKGDLEFTPPDGYVCNASPTSIPSKHYLRLETRSLSSEILTSSKDITLDLARKIAQQEGVKFSCDKSGITMSRPSEMDSESLASLKESATKYGIDYVVMNSGAGHDAAIMSKAGVPSAMLFLRHGKQGAGSSHVPYELLGLDLEDDPFRTESDFANSIRIIVDMVQKDLSPNFAPKKGKGFYQSVIEMCARLKL